jgi:hypothetical protein
MQKMVHPSTQGQASMVIITWQCRGNEILAHKIGIKNSILLLFKEKTAEEYNCKQQISQNKQCS